MSPKQVFVREATGLVRDISAFDAMMFNALTMGLLIAPIAVISFGFYAFPGANFTLGIILLAIIGMSVWIPYTVLAATMPRSGGDYVYQSRILSPAIGFTFSTGAWMFWTVYGVVWIAYSFCSYGISPFLNTLSRAMSSPALADAARWYLGPDAQYIVGLILTVVCFPQLILPLRYYAKLQKWFLMPAVLAGAFIIIGVLFSVSSAGFIANFNAWAQQSGASGDYYHYIINTALANGFNPNPGFSWYDTYGIVIFGWGAFAWAFFSSYFGGEIKRAGTLRNQILMVPGSVFLAAVIFIIMGLATTYVIGQEFYASALFLLYEHPDLISASISPYLSFFVGVAQPSISLALSFILLITFAACIYQYYFNSLIIGIRVMFAESFDRVLPTAFCDVSERFHTPVKSAVFCAVVGVFQILAWRFVPGLGPMVLAGTMATVPALLLTCVAGIVFPFRKKTKSIYDASPASKLKLAGLPLVTICGAAGIVFLLSVVYYWATVPRLGMASLPPLAYVVGVYAFLAIYYYAARAYRKRQGIDIDQAFQEIPPE